ncbi:hypothetical protein BdWA1_001954 [Babesia duncani]|uniref:Uncharacterized protein n=1 Tax=Babesia duncani TaxID=323732 RepID=A0AAD9UPE2_9APIC|nr:hypothetical protein BdWA1_001954 [Babesia duncani]
MSTLKDMVETRKLLQEGKLGILQLYSAHFYLDIFALDTFDDYMPKTIDEEGRIALKEKALAYSNEILEDPISYITEEESNKFVIPYPQCDTTYLIEVLTRPFRYKK